MSSERRHNQPPNRDDLQRFPPRDAACRSIRDLLRDYADEELARADRTRVEEHVHDCRDCSLALSRAEHEVVRLRRALEPRSEFADVPLNFASQVTALAAAAAEARLPRADAETSVRAERRGFSLVGLGAAGLVAAACALLMISLWGDPAVEVRIPGPVVVDARGAAWDSGVAAMRDETFLDGARLTLDTDGEAVLQLADDGGTVRVMGDSELRRRGAGFALDRGGIELDSDRPVELDLPEGVARLGVGEYVVTAQPIRAFDGSLEHRQQWRLRVEVHSGDDAMIVRGNESQPIAAGVAGIFESGVGARTEALVAGDLLAEGLRTGRPADPATTEDLWFGQLIDGGTGLPLVSANVTVWTENGPRVVIADQRGRFRLADMSIWEDRIGQHAVVSVRPSALGGSQPQPALMLPRPVRLQRRLADGTEFLTQPLVVPRARTLGGIVVDADGRPVAGATVLPAVLDETFGTVALLTDKQRATDGSGHYLLEGLPAELEPYQTLVVLMHTAGSAPAVVPVVADARLGAASPERVVLKLETRLDLTIPTTGGGWEVAEVVADLNGALALSRTVQVVDGVASVVVTGVGRTFVRPAGQEGQAWVEVERNGGGLTLASGTPLPRVLARAERSLRVGDLGVLWRDGRRFARVRALGSDAAASGASLVSAVEEPSMRARVAHLFVDWTDGARYAGTYGAFQSHPVRFPSAEAGTLWAITEDGALGQVAVQGGHRAAEVISVRAPGRLELPLQVQPMATRSVLRLTRGAETLLRVVEPGGHWQTAPIPAGSWTVSVDGGEPRVVDLQSGVVTLLR